MRPFFWLLLISIGLAACTTPLPDATRQAELDALLPAEIILLGEQHDAAEHHRLERDVVQWLADRGVLAALVVEMAERGHDTVGLSPHARAAEVRQALAWHDAGWPWAAYGPAVMAAVRAGVPVFGGNLPHAHMRRAMQEPALDRKLPAAALATQHERIRDGHCNTLPEDRIAPMARIQIARDQSLAETALEQRRAGGTVLVIAGNGHAARNLGIPLHVSAPVRVVVVSMRAGNLPSGDTLEADLVWLTPPLPPQDYCSRLHAKPAAG